MINHHIALIYAMVLGAAADGALADSELETIRDIVQHLPIFEDFEHGNLAQAGDFPNANRLPIRRHRAKTAIPRERRVKNGPMFQPSRQPQPGLQVQHPAGWRPRCLVSACIQAPFGGMARRTSSASNGTSATRRSDCRSHD